MYAVLLILSILSTAAGIFAVGFGIPVHDFNLGNTLFICGTVALVGGMVMFGLAAAVRQLRRIADTLGRPVPVPRRQPVSESAEGAPAPRRGPGAPVPNPPRPDAREARPAPALPPPVPTMEAPEPPPFERPRPNIFGVVRGPGEPPMVDEPETVPLAPSHRVPAAPIGRGGPPPTPEQMPEARSTSPADIMARLANLAAAPARAVPPPRPEPARTPPASERPPEPRQNMFDSLWPAEVRGNRPSQSETIARAPRSEARPEPRIDAKLNVKPEPQPDLRVEPPMPREPAVPPAEQRPIAILKSGVIDGMAYTLYTDGSIEAELPQGTMRFDSIDELRAHLESTER